MTDLILKSKTDVTDFVRGCTFFGTGGGGPPQWGLKILLEDIEKYGEIVIHDVGSVRDDAYVCTPYGMGSIAPKTPEVLQKMREYGLVKKIGLAEKILALAVLELEKYLGVEFQAIVPGEIGGSNTPLPIDVALSLGKMAINGDYIGRAMPEIVQDTLYLNDMPPYPTVYIDEYGNKSVIVRAINYKMAERLGKMLSVASFGLVAGAGFVMTGRELKKVIIPNTLSDCYEAGRTLREAREKGDDPALAVAKKFNGWVLFRGMVEKKDWEDREGYMWGYIHIKGANEFEGHQAKVWFKNENHIMWFDGKVIATSPDLVIIIESKSGEPITNTDLKEGTEVTVIGLRGREQFRTPKAISVHGPKYFGFDVEYVPIEERVSSFPVVKP
ncbi:MAG: DUF917 domain-containing protein [Desulfurococcales archaeon]|nr:DUF917 domain-containing protein [Desulfurococcales archaeon]